MSRQAEQVQTDKQNLTDLVNGFICYDNRCGRYVNIRAEWEQEETRIDAYAKRTGDYSIYDRPDPDYPLDDPNLSWTSVSDYIADNNYRIGCYPAGKNPKEQCVIIQIGWLSTVVIDANRHGSINRYAKQTDPSPIVSCKLPTYVSMQLYEAATQIAQRTVLDRQVLELLD